MAAPDEELLGKSRGYPMGTRANWYTDDSVRVGSYTNLDKLFSKTAIQTSAFARVAGAGTSVSTVTWTAVGWRTTLA
jgi:hypothetical protein